MKNNAVFDILNNLSCLVVSTVVGEFLYFSTLK